MLASRIILLFFLTNVTKSHKVGLMLSTEDTMSESIRRLAEFTISTLDTSETPLELEISYHDWSYLSIMTGYCDLLSHDVVAVISTSDSSLTTIEVNMASQFHVPLIAAAATNPFIESPSTDSFEIRLSPSDLYQSQVIFDILKEYNLSLIHI